MNLPEYVEVDGKKYKINTDFRVAIECNEIALDKSIDDEERAFAIIFKLFGKEGLYDTENHEKLLELGQKYLACGKELDTKGKPDMDFKQDYSLIWTSFMSDFNGLDIDKVKIHWWKFNDMISGLSNSELGNCCLLNKIRYIRNKKLSEIKDPKERQEMAELQKFWALKKYQKPKKEPTYEQKQNQLEFLSAIGIRKE